MEGLIELFLLLAITVAGWLLLKPALPPLIAGIGNWRVHHALQRSLPASHYKLFRDLVLRPEAPGEPATPTADEVIVSPSLRCIRDCERAHCRGHRGWTGRFALDL
jgi:hypothetical protein